MYGVFTYIYPKNGPNVGTYSIYMEHLGIIICKWERWKHLLKPRCCHITNHCAFARWKRREVRGDKPYGRTVLFSVKLGRNVTLMGRNGYTIRLTRLKCFSYVFFPDVPQFRGMYPDVSYVCGNIWYSLSHILFINIIIICPFPYLLTDPSPQGGAPQVISWFIIPLTVDISPT